MSVTTISGSIGLRAGDGRGSGGHNFGTNKSIVTSAAASSSSLAAIPVNSSINNSISSTTHDVKNNNISPNSNQLKTNNTVNVPTITISSSDSPLPKAYGKVVLTLNNVLLPEEKVYPTPSFLDGLDAESEIDLRIMGCELIVSSGTLLRLPQTAMATGQVLFQRFYYSKSFVRQPMETTAMACVYLASKIEEAPRRIRDVINVFHHIKQVRSGKLIQPMILDPSYIRLKSDVTLAERRVLKELGFCVHVKHPHKLIVIYMQQLGYDKDSRFVQMSWNYMNDALRSNVFVRYTPEAIACACIFLSARMLKILLPSSPAWYLVFDVLENQIIDICENILLLYERPKVNYEQLEKKVEILVKNYQDSRQKSKSGPTASLAEKAHLGTPNTSSPNSRPTSPSGGPQSVAPNTATKSKENSSNDTEKRRRHDDNDQDGRRSAPGSPITKKSRRSPSPIIYTPPRHKHKKRKKSRHSHSESSSPSRSRERRSLKKHARRERSRSPYSPRRHHHKKSKSHHRDRYKSRSRSFSPVERDRDRPPETLGKYDQKDYDKYYYRMKPSKSSSKHNRDREEDSGRTKSRDKDRR